MNRSYTKEVTYLSISAFFAVTVVLSNIFSAKMIILPILDLNVPAGLIVYPLTFLMNDFVTEVYGAEKSKLMVYVAFTISLLSFILIKLALLLPAQYSQEQEAFLAVLGLGGIRTLSSLAAFLTAQIVDVKIYAWMKDWLGVDLRFLWIRSNTSTWISQFVDTAVIDLLYLFYGLGMSVGTVLPIMVFSFAYKAAFSVLCTPLLYLSVFTFNRFLAYGSKKLTHQASSL